MILKLLGTAVSPSGFTIYAMPEVVEFKETWPMTTWLERRLARRSGTAGLETERLLLDLTENFIRKMVAKNVKRAELARRMGVDRAVVTRVMAGDRNVTLRTLVSVAASLGCRLKIEVEDDAAAEANAKAGEQLSEIISEAVQPNPVIETR